MTKTFSVQKILSFSSEEVWPILSNTALMNRKLGFPQMNFEVKDGIRHGSQKMLGKVINWTEVPWEWKKDAWLENERVYSNGFFKCIKGRFEVHSLGSNQSKISLAFSPEYRSAIFLKPLFNWTIKHTLKQLVDVIEKTLNENKKKVIEKSHEKSFKDWMVQAPDVYRAKIEPKEVASEIHSSWKGVFKDALIDNRLIMRFEAVCPHCRGGKKNSPRLTDIPEKVFCDSCEIEFNSTSQEGIEVSFRDSTIPANLIGVDFCSADVSKKPAIMFQKRGGAWEETLELASGVYSFKKKGEPLSLNFLVEESLPASILDVDHLWDNPSNATVKIGSTVKIVCKNLAKDGLVMVEHLSKTRGILTATEVLTVTDFADLLPHESLISSFPMEMGDRSILFTDVVGSTDLYYKIGDNAAFSKVRNSFLMIGEIAKRNNGTLVKTIGDATMYSFNRPEEALKTSLEILKSNRESEIKLRITIHHGSCLSVGTKDGLDFFGDTINVCAKFQTVANAGQVVFDKKMSQSVPPSYWEEISNQYNLEPLTFEMKGAVLRKFDLYRITL